MIAVRITLVCAAVLVYANEASQRSVTYFRADVCQHYMLGSMQDKDLPKYGKDLRNKTQEWQREMSDILKKWGGTETLREKCKPAGSTITVQGNTGQVSVMFFLEYMTILTSNEDKKVSTMLFHNCSKDNRSVELWKGIQDQLCYLLYYNDSQSPITTIDLCTDAIQNTSISGVMDSLADFGECLQMTNVSQCTQKLELFKRSWMSKRRRGKRGKGKRRGKGKGRKRGKGSRKRGKKEGKKGRRKAGRKGKKRNQNENDKSQN